MLYKVGDSRIFDISRSKKPYLCKEVTKLNNLPFEWEWSRGNCPHCNKKISTIKQYILLNMYVFENEEDIIALADAMDEGGSRLFLIPDEKFKPEISMMSIIEPLSPYLKEKKEKKEKKEEE